MKINDNMKKQKYEAPALTVVEFKAEVGYATSWSSGQVISSLEQDLATEIAFDAATNKPVAGYMNTGDQTLISSGWSSTMEGAGWF